MTMYQCIYQSLIVVCVTVILCTFFRTWAVAIKAQYWREKNADKNK